jgi:hypothetical protein
MAQAFEPPKAVDCEDARNLDPTLAVGILMSVHPRMRGECFILATTWNAWPCSWADREHLYRFVLRRIGIHVNAFDSVACRSAQRNENGPSPFGDRWRHSDRTGNERELQIAFQNERGAMEFLRSDFAAS